MVGKWLLYGRTLRHLRWQQTAYGFWRRLQRPPSPGVKQRSEIAESQAQKLAVAVAELGIDPARPYMERAAEILSGRFVFLNHGETLPVIDWRRRYVSHLWNYNLHYFDYAIDLAWAYRATHDEKYSTGFEALVSSWIEGTTDGSGDGWQPYAVSLRVVNWMYSVLILGAALSPGFRGRITDSIFFQLSFLERRVEWHLRANHVLKNLKALLIGGLLFHGKMAERWRRRATLHLWAQIHEQVLSDGGHFERSPMYHALSLADLLETVYLMFAAGEPVPDPVIQRIQKMVTATSVLTRAGGSMHLFNDSAHGVAPSATHLESVGRMVLGLGAESAVDDWSLPVTGYYGVRDATRRTELIIDCGIPGPAYQPGHAHCDLLSYEFDVAGMPVVVDSGVHGYDGDHLREYVRSTRAHNTVLIAGKEQSEMWATFRVARRADRIAAASRFGNGLYAFAGSYRPYHDRRCTHRRTITYEGNQLSVIDLVEGAAAAKLDSFVHFHPDFTLVLDDGRVSASGNGVDLSVEPFGVDSSVLLSAQDAPAQGWYCPEFGKAVPQTVLCMRIDSNSGESFGYRIRVVQSPS
jgi:uncharacterized heparinase superfamily protein